MAQQQSIPCQDQGQYQCMVTANLSVDFAGSAKVGDWVETSLDIQKAGSRMAFANVYFSVGNQRIARASGVFLVLSMEKVHPG